MHLTETNHPSVAVSTGNRLNEVFPHSGQIPSTRSSVSAFDIATPRTAGETAALYVLVRLEF